jgi:PAS domain S-box-containing protein
MEHLRGFDRVAELLPVGILRSDAQGRCLFLNRAGCAALGIDGEEAPGFGWTRTLSPADRDETRRAWSFATRSAQPLDLELAVRARGGPPRRVSCRVVPMVDAAGRVTGHVAALQDVGAVREGPAATDSGGRGHGDPEDEMRERMAHLTRVSTMGEMASSIAHEVNQPLTAVATYAQACRRLIEAGQADLSDVVDVLTRIAHEAVRAGDIIHRLKDMVRRHESRWAECDLNELARDVEALAQVDARLHDVRLVFEITPDLPHVLADGVQIQQVMLNLIRNGIDAVQTEGATSREVWLRTAYDGHGRLEVSVEDGGCGVPPEVERRLFQPFFTTKDGGMGMGLSISRSIVRAHRGDIGFARNPDGGSTFYFTLPMLEDA